MKFRGNSPAKIDSQGRLKIPTAHRVILDEHYGPDVYVTSLNGDCVMIYPMSEWEDIEARLLKVASSLPQRVKFLLHANYYGQTATMDKQGRILIQPRLRELADINGDVAVIGDLNHLVVWNHERIKNLLASQPYTDEEAAVLANLGI